MKHLFNDALTIYPEESFDEYGRRSYGSGVAVTGRFIETNKLLYDAKGEAIQTDGLIHIPSGTTIGMGSQVKYDSVNYRVVKVVKPKDHSSVRFIKVYVVKDNA